MKVTTGPLSLIIAVATVLVVGAGAASSNAQATESVYSTFDGAAGERPMAVEAAHRRHNYGFDFRHHERFTDRKGYHLRKHRHGHHGDRHHHHGYYGYPAYPFGYYDNFRQRGNLGHLTLCFRGSGVRVCYSDRFYRHHQRW